MKRLAGQAGRTLGGFFQLFGMSVIALFFAAAILMGAMAFRLSRGPLQIPGVATLLANAVCGADIDIHVGHAALGWAGFKNGGGVPFYLQLGDIAVDNHHGQRLATIPVATLKFRPSVFFGGTSMVDVRSSDAVFEGADVPVAMLAKIQLRHFSFADANLSVTLGAGQLGTRGLAEPLRSGRVFLTITPRDVKLTGGQFILTPVGGSAPVISVSGSAHRDGFWRGTIVIGGNSVQAPDLPDYWPVRLAEQTRSWVIRNINAGTASAAIFTFTLSAPGGLSNLKLDGATGAFTARDCTLIWIPGARPLTQLNGSFRLTDADDIDIDADSGMLGGIRLTGATMHIAGVAHHDQTGTLHIPIGGTVQNTFDVLNAPPLNLLKAVPAPVLAATGTMAGTVDVVVPFKKVVKIEDVSLKVSAALTDVDIPLPVDGLGLSQAALKVMSTTRNLAIDGDATLAGEPARLTVSAIYGPRNLPGSVKLDMQTAVTAKTLTSLGLDPDASIGGAMPLDIRIATTESNTGSVIVNADLTPAALKLPMFGWGKPAGKPGSFKFAASIDGRNSSGIGRIERIDAKADGLDVETQEAAGGLNLTRIHIGNTDGSGRIVPPSNARAPWRIDIFGNTLDASAAINPAPAKRVATRVPARVEKPAVPARPAAPSGPLWQATGHFDNLLLGAPPAGGLTDFDFSGNGQGSSVFDANATAMVGAGVPVALAVAPAAGTVPGYAERLQLKTADGGALLRAIGAYDDLRGGTLVFDASYGTASPFLGDTTITNFRLLNAPAFTKFLQAITVLGIPEAASGPGLEFSKLVAPFKVDNDILTLQGSRAYSASLGFTASGTVDLDAGIYDIHGTVVPAYALNALPGKIPLIGKLFSPEKGGGLFAMRYSMTGSTTDPKVTINPLSALTPGFLRGIFGLRSK